LQIALSVAGVQEHIVWENGMISQHDEITHFNTQATSNGLFFENRSLITTHKHRKSSKKKKDEDNDSWDEDWGDVDTSEVR
jgi:hypothetical protein